MSSTSNPQLAAHVGKQLLDLYAPNLFDIVLIFQNDAQRIVYQRRVERNGIDVITGTLPYKQKPAAADELKPHFDFATNLNLKAVDHIDGRPAIRQLTSRRLADVTVFEAWRGPCTVELRPNAQLPVFRLPVIEPLEGFFWRGEFTLVAGEIIHDYLEGDA